MRRPLVEPGKLFHKLVIKNVRGTDTGPPGETFFFDAYRSAQCYYNDCFATSDDGASCSTGLRGTAASCRGP